MGQRVRHLPAHEVAAILSGQDRRAPYWPQQPIPPGYAPNWRQKDAYSARLAQERVTGHADPRVAAWGEYERAAYAAWHERMKLAEQGARAGAGGRR